MCTNGIHAFLVRIYIHGSRERVYEVIKADDKIYTARQHAEELVLMQVGGLTRRIATY